MNNKERELLEYIYNNKQIKILQKQINEVDKDIRAFEETLDIVEGFGQAEEIVCGDLHNLRIRKLGLQVRANNIERKILQFELAQELAD